MLKKNTKEYKNTIASFHPQLLDELVIEGLNLWNKRQDRGLLKQLVDTQNLYHEYRKAHKIHKYPNEDDGPLEIIYATVSREEIENEVYTGMMTIFNESRFPLENAIEIGILTLKEWKKQNS